MGFSRCALGCSTLDLGRAIDVIGRGRFEWPQHDERDIPAGDEYEKLQPAGLSAIVQAAAPNRVGRDQDGGRHDPADDTKDGADREHHTIHTPTIG